MNATDGSQPNAPTAPKLGRVGAYEMLAEIASGGMATVFLARATDGRDGPPLVAIKRPHRHLASDKGFITMLIDEARLASSIDHPNVVRVRELGFEGAIPYVVMDYVEGASLADVKDALANRGRIMDTRVAVRMVVDALAGLHAAHETRDETGRHLGIVHRDVSPHNVLIGCDGIARLTDFGVAKAEDRVQTTQAHEVKGKLSYLAPERIDKRRLCVVQSDVFSMAVVLWECLAGRRLFTGDDAVETLQQVLNSPIPLLRDIGVKVPQTLDDVIARALSRDVDTRHPTAIEFAKALERAAGSDFIGQRADVARLMEGLFSEKMAERHYLARDAIGNEPVDELLRLSGLPLRDRRSIDIVRLDDIAPMAPSMPSTLGQMSQVKPALDRHRSKFSSWWVAAGVAFGLGTGVLVMLAVTPRPKPITRSSQAALPQLPMAAPELTTRRVVVPLPFLAAQVTFDDKVRSLEPASDVVAFEVPADSGQRHRVTAMALDGSRAEGFVREEDGVARAEGDGFTIYFSTPAPAPVLKEKEVREPKTQKPQRRSTHPAPPPAPEAKPIGTKHDGFTKLQ